MKKTCPTCKGSGHIITDYKICDACDGTGYQEEYQMSGHFKGVNKNARAKFDLDSEQDIPCEVCKGKGQIPVTETCKLCEGTGEINVCKKCGKQVPTGQDLCEECEKDMDIAYIVDPLCTIDDLEIGQVYKGTVTRVEKYGVFVSLSKQLWGLLRTGLPDYGIGDEILVKITKINHRKHEVDLGPVKGEYQIKVLKKEINRTPIGQLNEKDINKLVKLTCSVSQVQQTSGPTIFNVFDETGRIGVAAFDKAGERTYPEIENDDLIEVIGEVNLHSGILQIESELIEKLGEEDSLELSVLIEKAIDEQSEVTNDTLLVDSPILRKLKPSMMDVAKIIRKAIIKGDSILLRHHADADGITAGIAMEKAILPLIEENNPGKDAKWHYFKRSPSKAPFYEVEDFIKDVSFALEDFERHGQKLPLIILLDNGSTEEDLLSLIQASIYDIDVVVIDHHFPGEVKDGRVLVDEYIQGHVNPYLVGGDSQITAGALSVEVAKMVNPDIIDDIKHLPGIAAIGDHVDSEEAEEYIRIASDMGYTREKQSIIADCVDFEAYYLRFMNGRGIMDTILNLDHKDKHEALVETLYREYQNKVKLQLDAAKPHLKTSVLENGIILNTIDITKYTHKFTFPAAGKTCGFLHDSVVSQKSEGDSIVTLAKGSDFTVMRATNPSNEVYGFSVNTLIDILSERIPEAGVDGGGHECAGTVKFLEGLSDKVLSLLVEEITKLG